MLGITLVFSPVFMKFETIFFHKADTTKRNFDSRDYFEFSSYNSIKHAIMCMKSQEKYLVTDINILYFSQAAVSVADKVTKE